MAAMSTPTRPARFHADLTEYPQSSSSQGHGSATGTRPGSAPTPVTIDMKEALSRANGDPVAAIDQILAERNQFCLDNAKLSSENVRIWNLMGRIRKENEALKNRAADLEKAANSKTAAAATTVASSSPIPARRRLPTDTDKSPSPLSPPRHASRGEHTDVIGSTAPRARTVEDPPTRPANPTPSALPPREVAVINNSSEQGTVRLTPSEDADSMSRRAAATPQSSIMQQRALAQAQSLALSQSNVVKGSESTEFEAIDQDMASDNGNHKASASTTSLPRVRTPVQNLQNNPPATPSKKTFEQERNLLASGPKSQADTPAETMPPSTSSKSLVSKLLSENRVLRSPGSKRSKEVLRRAALAPRLDSQLLRVASIQIQGTNYRSIAGKESISFFISVEIVHPPASWGLNSLASGEIAPPTSWTIEKSYIDIVGLDAKQRNKVGKKASQRLAPLPDKSLFKDHAPAKVDQRKALLEIYLQSLMVLDLPDKDEVCTFLCTDVVPNQVRDPLANSKTGFLIKKGQNLGRWVTRYYVLRDSTLTYYESQGGAQVGFINLHEAQIGRQQKSSTANEQDENAYRHAFLVLEKRPGSYEEAAHIARHVLCAETDEERDDWVDVLVRAIAELDEPLPNQTQSSVAPASSTAAPLLFQPTNGMTAPQASTTDAAPKRPERDPNVLSPRLAALSLDTPKSPSAKVDTLDPNARSHLTNVQAGGIPTSPSFRSINEPRSPVVSRVADSQDSQGSPGPRRDSQTRKGSISAPTNGAVIPTGYKFGAKDEQSTDTRKDDKKGRFWQGFRNKNTRDARPVFGVPLSESIAISSIHEGLALPSVVYRCVEYLEKRDAFLEEGLYRLSGSSATVKMLKDRFNMEGDVDLLADDQYYDPHAIAGLLKTFLRELPTSVLTRELHMDFMRIHEINDRAQRVNELGNLVSQLPLANYSLLRTLCSHLINIIQHSDVNKMTMRNVGIVFSPTLAIGAGIFALFLTEFDSVFETDVNGEPAPKRMVSDVAADATVATDSPKGKNSHRNSVQYRDSQMDRLLGLESKSLTYNGVEEDVEGMAADPADVSDGNRDFWTGNLNQPMDVPSSDGHLNGNVLSSGFSQVTDPQPASRTVIA